MKSLRAACLLFIVFFAFAIGPGKTNAQEDPRFGVGLEVERGLMLGVQLNDGAKEIGLTEDRLRNKAEVRLRSADINLDGDDSPGLRVDVSVVGQAFHAELSLLRRVIRYDVGSVTYQTFGATWESSRLGTHGGDSNYVVGALDALLDQFINKYFEAQKMKEVRDKAEGSKDEQ